MEQVASAAEGMVAESPRQDVASLVQRLQQALTLEAKFQPKLQLPTSTPSGTECGEITSAMRDGAAHVLRCLKVWYDLPSSVLLAALNLMDRFMSRMKARPKHLSCIAISSFHLAANQWVERVRSDAGPPQGSLQVPEPQDLVMISQCKCTASDILRMEKIVEAKLGCLPQEEPVTVLTFLSLYHRLLATTLPVQSQPDLQILSNKLETICCDYNYATYPASQLGLALLSIEVRRTCEDPYAHNVMLQLQQLLHVSDDVLGSCVRMVTSILAPYDGYAQTAPSHRQRLTWKLSRRTLKQLRPTEKLVSVLPTIEENRQFGQLQRRNRRTRMSPRKIRPASPSLLASMPLPFPTKEDLASFFDNFVPTPHPYPFRFLFGLEEESSSSSSTSSSTA